MLIALTASIVTSKTDSVMKFLSEKEKLEKFLIGKHNVRSHAVMLIALTASIVTFKTDSVMKFLSEKEKIGKKS